MILRYNNKIALPDPDTKTIDTFITEFLAEAAALLEVSQHCETSKRKGRR